MPKKNIKAVIDRFEGTWAVLVFDDGQILNWSIKNLPNGLQEGAVLRFTISVDSDEESERQQTAKDLLNEILKNSV